MNFGTTSSTLSPVKAYNDIWDIYEKGDTSTSSTSANNQMIIMDALPEVSDKESYQEYMKKFQEYVEPSLWGTTVFPLVSKPGQIVQFDLNLFFRDLEILSLISRYCGRPFWYTVRCMSYTNKETGISTPYPNIIEMRFSAFAALAYGAQGLQYWCFRQLKDNSTYEYTAAPVDVNGQKVTEVWDAVYQLNQEIFALNDVFFESELVKVCHTGTKQYDATCMLNGSFGPIISISSTSILISHLNTHGQDYIVIVDQPTTYSPISSPRTQKLTLNFATSFYDIKQIKLSKSGTYVAAYESEVTSQTVEVDLPYGGYLIYKWNPK